MSKILDILKETKAILTESHFVYTSGKHGPVYINKDTVYTDPQKASNIGMLFAQRCKDLNIDIVAAPALGGIVLSQWTAYHLSLIKKKKVLAVYTEKTVDNNQIFKRGYNEIVKGKNALVVEDLTTTGGSVKKVVDSVKQAGGRVVAVGVMIDRSTNGIDSKTVGAPFFCLGKLPSLAYTPKKCPLCKSSIPINTSVGHGKKFLSSSVSF